VSAEKNHSESQSHFLRPLGTSERFYWIYDQLACTNFSVIAEIDGIISLESLKSAIARAIVIHPVLRIKVNAGPGNRLDFASVTEKEAIDNIDVKAISTSSVNRQLLQETDTQFKPGSFPMMRCRIIHGTPKVGSTIIFTFHHSMTDATGGVFLVRNILAYLFSPSSVQAIDVPDGCDNDSILDAQESLYPIRYRGWRILFSLVRGIAGKCTEALRRGRSEQLPAIGKSAAHRQLDIIQFSFDEKQTEALIQACRTEKTTVHGFLCSSLLLAIREEFAVGDRNGKEMALTLITAVNMRQWLAKNIFPENTPGMFASMVPTTHRVKAFMSPWDLAHDINKQLAANLDSGAAHMLWKRMPSRWITPDMNGARRIFRLLSVGPKGPIVTNLGAITPPQTAAETTVRSLSFTIGPAAYFPLCITANSWAGKLFVNCTFDGAAINRRQAEGIMARIRQRLLVG
jgi:hypothetical protein